MTTELAAVKKARTPRHLYLLKNKGGSFKRIPGTWIDGQGNEKFRVANRPSEIVVVYEFHHIYKHWYAN